jgi:hypothetical protein
MEFLLWDALGESDYSFICFSNGVWRVECVCLQYVIPRSVFSSVSESVLCLYNAVDLTFSNCEPCDVIFNMPHFFFVSTKVFSRAVLYESFFTRITFSHSLPSTTDIYFNRQLFCLIKVTAGLKEVIPPCCQLRGRGEASGHLPWPRLSENYYPYIISSSI